MWDGPDNGEPGGQKGPQGPLQEGRGSLRESFVSKRKIWGKGLSQHSVWLSLEESQDPTCYVNSIKYRRSNLEILRMEPHVAYVDIWSSQ